MLLFDRPVMKKLSWMASNEIACHIPNTSNLRVCPSPTVGGAVIFGVRQGWDTLRVKKVVLLSGGWPATFMSAKSISVYFFLIHFCL